VPIGDRCNGGISTVSLKDKKLTYTINITPYDFITLSNTKIPKLQAYDDLAACAACCQGTATFESDFENSHLVSIDLGELSEQSQGMYQDCFNRLLKEYIANGQKSLNPDELNKFVEKFKSKCIQEASAKPM
jgi:N-acetyl-beta-hexosaminidase